MPKDEPIPGPQLEIVCGLYTAEPQGEARRFQLICIMDARKILKTRLSRAQMAFLSSSLFCSLVGNASSHKFLSIDGVTALMYS